MNKGLELDLKIVREEKHGMDSLGSELYFRGNVGYRVALKY